MSFNNVELDVLTEIANIGASKAATSLSMMMGFDIQMHVPSCKMVPFANICDSFGGPDKIICGTLVQMSGQMDGYIILLLDIKDACKLVSKLTYEDLSYVNENTDFNTILEKLEPIKEVANILISSYLGAISLMTDYKITPTVPELSVDMALAIMNVPAMVYGEIGDEILLMDTKFGTKDISGQFLLIPTIESYENLMKVLNINS